VAPVARGQSLRCRYSSPLRPSTHHLNGGFCFAISLTHPGDVPPLLERLESGQCHKKLMDDRQSDWLPYDLLMCHFGDVLVARVMQPDRHRALALAQRLNRGGPVAVVAVEDGAEQT